MRDYKEMYFQLVGKVEDAIDLLIEAKVQCEEAYINDDDKACIKKLNTKNEKTAK